MVVEAKRKLVKVDGSVSATLDGKGTLTIDSPKIDYVSKMEVTKTLPVNKQTTVNSLEVTKDTNLDGTVKYTGSANDRDPILQGIGGTVPTLTRTEQLP